LLPSKYLMETEEVWFDVIVPTYKVSVEFITRCLESVKTQTHPHWRCWIVDGTPKDDESYQPMMDAINLFTKSPNFTFMRQSGKGVSQARNEAIASGDFPYIATLDGDDVWYPEHLEWMTESIRESDDRVVLWWAGADAELKLQSLKTGEVYTKIGVIGWYGQYEKIRPKDIHYFLRGNPVIPSNAVKLRSRFEKVGGYDETLQIGEDTDLYLRLTGDPSKLGYENAYLGCQVDAVSGYHGCGPWQTTAMGHQTSAADNRNFDETKAEFDRQTLERIKKERLLTMEDKPDDVTEDYWNFLMEVIGQKYKSIIIMELSNGTANESIWQPEIVDV